MCNPFAPQSGKGEPMDVLQSPSPPVGTGEGGGLRNKELEVSRRKREGRKVDI